MTGPADDHLSVWAGTRHGSLSPSQSISAPNPERWDVHGDHDRKDGTEAVTGMMNVKLDAGVPKGSDLDKHLSRMAAEGKTQSEINEFVSRWKNQPKTETPTIHAGRSRLDAAFRAADALYARADAMEQGDWSGCEETGRGGYFATHPDLAGNRKADASGQDVDLKTLKWELKNGNLPPHEKENHRRLIKEAEDRAKEP